MSNRDRFCKRLFDITGAAIGLFLLSPVILCAAAVARLSTGASGIFSQTRIGRHGKPFTIRKIRTMKASDGTHITAAGDARITRWGAFFRQTKIDELPQLWNVLVGEMSFVGPRPDMPGYADRLAADDRILLELRPGITGPATLKYRGEEELLAMQLDPIAYNDQVIWPDKVKINRQYYERYRFANDLKYILRTVIQR